MATLRPPSASPSPSPGPENGGGGKNLHSRASMGPSMMGGSFGPASPRPGGGPGGNRPTSELLSGSGMYQTPEVEAIDQWFENLQNYETTLEDMAQASLDVNFKEELSAIEQWFKVLSEAERTAALYSLLQHSTQVQIRFFITVLQQMARSDPMTAILSPAMGGSMQQQMEAKLATMSLKSPGLKSNMPSSPSARNFSGAMNPNRQSLTLDSASSFLAGDNGLPSPAAAGDAAATLVQQRAKLKASNAAHRISAPVLSTSSDGRNVWGTQLGQVAESGGGNGGGNAAAQEIIVGGSQADNADGRVSPRPPRPGDLPLSPMVGGSWESMVKTPAMMMFPKGDRQSSQQQQQHQQGADASDWNTTGNSGNGGPRVPLLNDPPKNMRRTSKNAGVVAGTASSLAQESSGVYDNDGNLINVGQQQQQQQQQQQRNGGGGWNGARSPALSNVSSGRFPNSAGGGGGAPTTNEEALASMMGMNGFNMGLASPGLAGLGGMAGLAGMNMNQMNPYMLNMAAMGLGGPLGMGPSAADAAQAQLLAAQMAARGFGPQAWMNIPGLAAGMGGAGGVGGMNMPGGARRAPRSPGKSPSNNGRGGGGGGGPGGVGGLGGGDRKDEEEVDPALLNDIPAWLRSLRLHKYTPNFEGMRWQDIVAMDEAALEAKGVAALGARRKMLKTFDLVRKKMGMEDPAGGASA